jgi:hypothetical protein
MRCARTRLLPCGRALARRSHVMGEAGTHRTTGPVVVAAGETAPGAVRLGTARTGHREELGFGRERTAVAPRPADEHHERAHDQGEDGQPFEEQDRTQRDDDAHRGTRHGDAQRAGGHPIESRSWRAVGGGDAPEPESGGGPRNDNWPRTTNGRNEKWPRRAARSGVPRPVGARPGCRPRARPRYAEAEDFSRECAATSSDQVSERVVTSTPAAEMPPASSAARRQQCTQSWNWISRATRTRL